MKEVPIAPLVLRGQVVTDDLVEYPARQGVLTFRAPDLASYANRIPLASPTLMEDLYDLSLDEIVAFLCELGHRLDLDKNPYMQEALELTCFTSDQTQPLLENAFRAMPALFAPEALREMAERAIGLNYLQGWVPTVLSDGTRASVRAFGARSAHIIAGNGAASAAFSIIRGALTRSDTILKTPSNNPFVAPSIARTLLDIDPAHPIARHLVVAYWRGGDARIEERLFQPHNLEKIIAWGGFASVKHVTRYIQPGLELISLDPKYSTAILGAEVVADQELMREAAKRIAVDVGAQNQTACSSPRVVYVLCENADDPAIDQLAELTCQALARLPTQLSTPPKLRNRALQADVEALEYQQEWFTVFGDADSGGTVIVSRLGSPVDFMTSLADRTVNFVPIQDLETFHDALDSYTQTVGVFPEQFKDSIRDRAALSGVQRFVSLGYACHFPAGMPHDGLELERRMCKWIVDLDTETAARHLPETWPRGALPFSFDAIRAGQRAEPGPVRLHTHKSATPYAPDPYAPEGDAPLSLRRFLRIVHINRTGGFRE